MRFSCSRCRKKFNYKPNRVPYIACKPYCHDCYEIQTYYNRLDRNITKDKKRQIPGMKTPYIPKINLNLIPFPRK